MPGRLCYEEPLEITGAMTWRRPRMAMDEAPPKDPHSALINALTKWAVQELTPDQQAALELIITNAGVSRQTNGDDPPTFAGAPKTGARDETDEEALRTLEPEQLTEILKHLRAGTGRGTATDAKATAAFRARFPEAGRLDARPHEGNKANDFAGRLGAKPRAAADSYATRFPRASKIGSVLAYGDQVADSTPSRVEPAEFSRRFPDAAKIGILP